MVSKALVVAAYHGKLVNLAAQPDLELLAVAPHAWKGRRQRQAAEPVQPLGYELVHTRMWLNGHYHLYLFPGLGRLLRRFRPDIVHIDEEPYNAATWHACRLARAAGARCIFFAWQNLARRYPPPFGWIERYVYARADGIAGTAAAAQVLRGKGFRRQLAEIPQFGIDPAVFAPAPRPSGTGRLRVGYAGRLVPEKGVEVLIQATQRAGDSLELLIAGQGPAGPALRRLAGAAPNIRFLGALASHDMPGFYRGLDVFVQPTVGRHGWTEQFGRAAVEAMACGVPTVVSDAGELPAVVGSAARVVPAGRPDELADALRELGRDSGLRGSLGAAGRAHVLERYAHDRIARATADFYRAVLAAPRK